jgi:hypothetical protein
LQVAWSELPLWLGAEDAAQDRVQGVRVVVEAAVRVAAGRSKATVLRFAGDNEGWCEELRDLVIEPGACR